MIEFGKEVEITLNEDGMVDYETTTYRNSAKYGKARLREQSVVARDKATIVNEFMDAMNKKSTIIHFVIYKEFGTFAPTRVVKRWQVERKQGE